MKTLLIPFLAFLPGLLLLPAQVHSQAQAQVQAQVLDAGWRQCRTTVDAAARLACYDALPAGPLAAAAPASAVPAGATAANRPAASVTGLESQFGLATPADRVTEIATRFEGLFEGWRSGDRITLANGQVWQVTDGSSAVYNLRSPRVTIRRGSMGQFVLDVEGAKKLATVRRVQ